MRKQRKGRPPPHAQALQPSANFVDFNGYPTATVELLCSDDWMSWEWTEEVVAHVDMDCFFVSVLLVKRPELVGASVAVTHATGKGKGVDSWAEVSTSPSFRSARPHSPLIPRADRQL